MVAGFMERGISKLKKRRILHLIISLLLTIILVVSVFREEGSSRFFEMVKGVMLSFLLVYVGLSILGVLLRAYRYGLVIQSVLPQSEVPNFGKLLVVTIIRNAFVDILPARLGEATYFYFLNRYGVPILAGLSTFGICLVFDIVILFVLVSFLAMIFSLSGGAAISPFHFEPFTISLVVFCLLVFCYAIFSNLEAILTFVENLIERILLQKEGQSLSSARRSFLRGVREVGGHLRAFLRAGNLLKLVIVTALLRIFKYSSLYFLLLAVVFQYNVTFLQLNPLRVLLSFLFAEGAASLPFSGIMGFGAYEGVWSMIFAISCESCEVLPPLAQVAFLIHLITQIKGYFLGLVGLFIAFVSSKPRSARVVL